MSSAQRMWVIMPRIGGVALGVLVAVSALLTALPGVPGSFVKGFFLVGLAPLLALAVAARVTQLIPQSIRRMVLAQREGRALLREARTLLKRRRTGMDPAAREKVEEQLAALERALAGDDVDALVKALRELDETADKHLAVARKSTMREYAESIGVAILLALFLRTFVVEAFKIPSGSMIPTLMVGDHIFLNKYLYGIRIPLTYTKFFEWRTPERGEVVVFIKPSEPDKDYIKRIIGTAGDTVVVTKGVLTKIIPANGAPPVEVKLDFLRDVACDAEPSDEAIHLTRGAECQLFAEGIGDAWHSVLYAKRSNPAGLLADIADGTEERYTVPETNVFCMGDNRDNSSDSRMWGTVPLDHIKGRAMVIWWSFGDLWQRWHRFGAAIK